MTFSRDTQELYIDCVTCSIINVNSSSVPRQQNCQAQYSLRLSLLLFRFSLYLLRVIDRPSLVLLSTYSCQLSFRSSNRRDGLSRITGRRPTISHPPSMHLHSNSALPGPPQSLIHWTRSCPLFYQDISNLYHSYLNHGTPVSRCFALPRW